MPVSESASALRPQHLIDQANKVQVLDNITGGKNVNDDSAPEVCAPEVCARMPGPPTVDIRGIPAMIKFRFVVIFALVVIIILGPSFYVSMRAKHLAEERFGRDNYCWVRPVEGDLDVSSGHYPNVHFWRDFFGISQWGEQDRQAYFGLIVIGSDHADDRFGWSYQNMDFYKARSVIDFRYISHLFHSCEKYLKARHAD